MIIEKTGRSFEVPLIDMTGGTWMEGANQFSNALLRNVAVAGLSAACYSIRQSGPEVGLGVLEFGDLFDDTGKFIGDSVRRQLRGIGDIPGQERAEDFMAGIHVARIAFTASRLLGSLEGRGSSARTIELPVLSAEGQAQAGEILGTHPVRNVQLRVVANEGVNVSTRLDLAAALSTPTSSSTTATLWSRLHPDLQIAEVSLSSADREGDLVCSGLSTTFAELGSFAEVIDHNLPH